MGIAIVTFVKFILILDWMATLAVLLLPVFTTLLIARDNCPFRRELSSLTSSIRQQHSTNKEEAKRIKPISKSDKEQFTKRCLPGREGATAGITDIVGSVTNKISE